MTTPKMKSGTEVWPKFTWIGDVLQIKDGLAYYDSLKMALDKNRSHCITLGDFVLMESKKNEPYIAQIQVLYENISLGNNKLD